MNSSCIRMLLATGAVAFGFGVTNVAHAADNVSKPAAGKANAGYEITQPVQVRHPGHGRPPGHHHGRRGRGGVCCKLHRRRPFQTSWRYCRRRGGHRVSWRRCRGHGGGPGYGRRVCCKRRGRPAFWSRGRCRYGIVVHPRRCRGYGGGHDHGHGRSRCCKVRGRPAYWTRGRCHRGRIVSPRWCRGYGPGGGPRGRVCCAHHGRTWWARDGHSCRHRGGHVAPRRRCFRY